MTTGEPVIVPGLDPLGLPAPPAWFTFLHLLTLLLHLLFMNFVLGGQVLACGLNVAALLGRRPANAIANLIYQMTPPTLSMAITMGVAPLLFVQVLHSPFFYSANVLMGFAWFSFVVVLLAGFYLSHWLAHQGSSVLQHRHGAWDARPGRRLLVGTVVAAAFLWVAWVLTNNHELSLHPGLWSDGETWQSPRWYVPAAAPARYLHNVVGASAVAGLWLVVIGRWRIRRAVGDTESNIAMIRFGLMAAACLTIVQFGVGLYFLLSLDPAVWRRLMGFQSFFGGIWTLTLPLTLLLPVACVYARIEVGRSRRSSLAVAAGIVLVVGMLMGHEQVRTLSLSLVPPESVTLDRWAVYPQWGPMALFVVVLLAGLGTVGWMLAWVARPAPSPAGMFAGANPEAMNGASSPATGPQGLEP